MTDNEILEAEKRILIKFDDILNKIYKLLQAHSDSNKTMLSRMKSDIASINVRLREIQKMERER